MEFKNKVKSIVQFWTNTAFCFERNLLRMPTKNAEFSFNNLIFCRIDVVAMESPFGSIPFNIYVGYYENIFYSN